MESLYITLISGNMKPNFIFDFYLRKEYSNYDVILICTEDVIDQTNRIYNYLRKNNKEISITKVLLYKKSIKDLYLEIYEKTSIKLSKYEKYIFNLTCGTKEQSIALNEVFNDLKTCYKEKAYMDSARKKIYFEYFQNQQRNYKNISFKEFNCDEIRLQDFIELQYKGKVETKIKNNSYLVKLSEEIFNYFVKNEKKEVNYKQYNSYISQFDHIKGKHKRCNEMLVTKTQITLINKVKNKLKEMENLTKKVKEEYFGFLHGFWFEYYLYYHIFEKLKEEKIIDEVLWSVEEKNKNKKQAEFEVDFILRKNFDTYAISVTTDNSEYYEHKIYEIYNRSQKILGNENQFAMVSFASKKSKMIDSIYYKHFNFSDLENLKLLFKEWITGGNVK